MADSRQVLARLRQELETEKAQAQAILGKENVSADDEKQAQSHIANGKRIAAELKSKAELWDSLEADLKSLDFAVSSQGSGTSYTHNGAKMVGNVGTANVAVDWSSKRAVASWGLDVDRRQKLTDVAYAEAFGQWITGQHLSNETKSVLDLGLIGSHKGQPEYLFPLLFSTKDWTEGTAATAGLNVPAEFRPQIVERQPGPAPLYDRCTKIQTVSKQLDLPRSTNTDSNYTSAIRVTQVNERPAVSGSFPTYDHKVTDPAFEQVQLSVGTRMAYIDCSENLMEDWLGAMGYLNAKFSEAFRLDMEYKILLGSGTSGAPQGIITLLKSAETQKPARLASGTSGDFTAQNVKDVDKNLADQYDSGATWIMRKATRYKIGDFTSANKPVFFDPVAQWSGPLLEKAVIRSGFMPLADDATNKVPILLGNLAGYYIVERVGFSVRLNPYIVPGTIRVESRARDTGKLLEPWWFSGLECVVS